MRISDWSSDVSLPIYCHLVFTPIGRQLMFRSSPRFCRKSRSRRRSPPNQYRGKSLSNLALFLSTVGSACGNSEDYHDEDFYRSEEHTSELQSLMRISYAVFCLKKKNKTQINT